MGGKSLLNGMYAAQQKRVSEKFSKQYNIPILLYSQLLGLAMGADPVAALGLNLDVLPVDKLPAKIGNVYKECGDGNGCEIRN